MPDVVARNLASDPRRIEREAREDQYWSASASLDRRPATAASETEMCPRCGTEFIIGSRFCYACGCDRDLPGKLRRGRMGWLDFNRLHQRLGMGPAALVAFIAGAVCLLAAALTGVMYTATTMIDWQAVQLWRMQWLLAAVAAFVAGILLKRPAKPE
ncbi:MAG: hypothetical protein M3P27_06150 [Acidobacteriota bacterium]|nr:hypothetical protein [Acidobacteriota bacterium]